MRLAFSIDALDAAGSHAWRLLDDQRSWRACTYAEPLHAGDARLNARTAEKLTGHRMQQDKDSGLTKRGKTGMFDFLMRGIFTHAILHRLADPPVPSRDNMLATIAGLEPGTPWLLYLDVAGHFRALDSNHSRIIGNLDIAVRGEIASSPAYIGAGAVSDEALMDRTWRQFLGGWLEHLKSGNMAVFVPDVEKLREESIYLEEIGACRPECSEPEGRNTQ